MFPEECILDGHGMVWGGQPQLWTIVQPSGEASVSEFPFSEGELIKRSQERTLDGRPTPAAKRAFGTLYLAYQRRIFTFLAHALGSIERAEDLTQDTFVNAWRKISDFQDQPAENGTSVHSAFSRWLYTIARNEMLQYWRKLKGSSQQEGSLDVLDEHDQLPSIDPYSQDMEEQVILRDEINVVLYQLTRKRRLLLILYHKVGFTYAQIAQFMGMSISAVSSGLCRANEQFQELYMKRQTEQQAPIAEQAKKGGLSQ
jgi:RNA polymerase sigma-70 factor (ECF subfamily)